METSDKRANDETADKGRKEPATARPLIVNSKELIQGRRELWIEHGEEMYRLRVTSSGKLYLTK